MAGLPPVWSACQCVLTTNRTGFLEIVASAAFSLALSGASSSSIRNTPSFPTVTATLPPANPLAPSIIETPFATGVTLTFTLLGSPICARADKGSRAAAIAATRNSCFNMRRRLPHRRGRRQAPPRRCKRSGAALPPELVEDGVQPVDDGASRCRHGRPRGAVQHARRQRRAHHHHHGADRLSQRGHREDV